MIGCRLSVHIARRQLFFNYLVAFDDWRVRLSRFVAKGRGE